MEHPTILKAAADAENEARRYLLKGATSLPPDVLRDAAKRLAICGLVMAALFAIWTVLYPLLPVLGGQIIGEAFGWAHLLSVLLLGLSLGVFFLARSRRIPPQLMLDLGLVFEVVIAFFGAVILRVIPGPLLIPTGWGISELCMLILIFPVIVPNTPGKTFLAALITASMDPLGVQLALASGKTLPPDASLFVAFFSNYICAGLALIPSFILHQLARQVTHAREMGSYRLIEMLGRGGMGEVWRANHRLLAREAAIKIVRPEVLVGRDQGSQQVLLKRFEREAQATAQLCSPHTIDLYDYGISEDGTFYYVMELLEGFDLDSLVEQFGPLPPARAVHLLRQICDSLAEAHASGLIHRDIKPANAYVCRYGRRVDFIKVLDFGLVKPQMPVEADLTGEHTPGGTPAFMAPEQVLGDRPVDARTDLYAIGCLGYWLLTGQHVFTGDTAMQIMMEHVRTPAPPASSRTELSIPAALDAVLLDCLAKDPDQRPPDADALAARLRAAVADDSWRQDDARAWWDLHRPAAPARVTL